MEARAHKVHVVFEEITDGGGQPTIKSVAFIDDGSGMFPEMARYALTWGGGTHCDDPTFIGRFGFGIPNASINQTQTVEVYTRTSPDQKIVKAWLDIRKAPEHGLQQIPAPVEAELPAFVSRYLEKIV